MQFRINKKKSTSYEIKTIIGFYILISIFLVFFEHFDVKDLIVFLKPLLVPILCFIYISVSVRVDYNYLTALLFGWLTNIFFIFPDKVSVQIATTFFILSRILILYIVFKDFKQRNLFALVLGSIPFISIFCYLLFLSIPQINLTFYVFFTESVVMSVMSGYAMSKYILKPSKTNYYLLASCVSFSLLQCIYLIRNYYINIEIFKPMLAMFYCFGQYTFLQFMLLNDEKKIVK